MTLAQREEVQSAIEFVLKRHAFSESVLKRRAFFAVSQWHAKAGPTGGKICVDVSPHVL